jgi:hypothetical protein
LFLVLVIFSRCGSSFLEFNELSELFLDNFLSLLLSFFYFFLALNLVLVTLELTDFNLPTFVLLLFALLSLSFLINLEFLLFLVLSPLS